MKLYPFLLCFSVYLTSCETTKNAATGTVNTTAASKVSVDSVAEVRRAAIDRNKLNSIPVSAKPLRMDSIP